MLFRTTYILVLLQLLHEHSPSQNCRMRNQSSRTHEFTGSPTSIRDAFNDDIRMVRMYDDSPFDEPPHSGVRYVRKSKYSLDGYSFYQSSSKLKNGYVVNDGPMYISQSLTKNSVPSDPTMHGYDTDDEEDDDTNTEYSDGSSFLSSYQMRDNEKDNEYSECHNFDAIALNLQTFLGLEVSSFRSKPLPKPVVWKGYTCFRGKWPYQSTADTVISPRKRDAPEIASLCCTDECGKKANNNKNACEGVSPEGNQVETSSAATETGIDAQPHVFFDAKAPQEYLECATTSAHELLKSWIFTEDPDECNSKGEGDDSDSITYGSR